MEIRHLLRRVPSLMRRSMLEKYRQYKMNATVKPTDGKMIGFFGEAKVARAVPFCFICNSHDLKYSCIHDLKGEGQPSWRDIECNRCGEFIVEIKSTMQSNPTYLQGGSYSEFVRLPVRPYLMVNHNVQYVKNQYVVGIMDWYLPWQYKVKKTTNNRSRIVLF